MQDFRHGRLPGFQLAELQEIIPHVLGELAGANYFVFDFQVQALSLRDVGSETIAS